MNMVIMRSKPKYEKNQFVLLSKNVEDNLVLGGTKKFTGIRPAIIKEAIDNERGVYKFVTSRYRVYLFDTNSEFEVFEEYLLTMPKSEQIRYKQLMKALGKEKSED